MDEGGVYRIEVWGYAASGARRRARPLRGDRSRRREQPHRLVSDSAALYGLLARLEAVGLALMAVAQLHADTTTDRGDTP